MTSWSNLPACDDNGRAGIRHGDLTAEQVQLVLAVAMFAIFESMTDDDFASAELDGNIGELLLGPGEDGDISMSSGPTVADLDIEGSYGRIDGPSVWIEIVNEGGVGGNDIHVHSIYRDKNDDYGSAA